MPGKELSKAEETYVKKMAKKYGYTFKEAKKKFHRAYKNAEKSDAENVHALARKIFVGDLAKKNDVEEMHCFKNKKKEVEEKVTTTTANVTPGSGPGTTGAHYSRAWEKAIKRQYKDDEKQRQKAMKSGLAAVNYLKQNLKL